MRVLEMIRVTNCGDDGLTEGVETWLKKSSNSAEKQLDFANRWSEHESRRLPVLLLPPPLLHFSTLGSTPAPSLDSISSPAT